MLSARRNDGTTRTVLIHADGTYRLRLPPGIYTLSVQTGTVLPRCPPATVSVPAETTIRADVSCDTGIR
jgi:hypothetical protein